MLDKCNTAQKQNGRFIQQKDDALYDNNEHCQQQ